MTKPSYTAIGRVVSLRRPVVITFLLALFLTANLHASPPHQRHTFSKSQLGTVTKLIFYSPSRTKAQQLADDCFQSINTLEKTFSDYLPDSELNQLCQKALNQDHSVSPHLFNVLQTAQSISQKSEGTFDITLGRWTHHWRQKKETPSLKAIDPPAPLHYQNLVLDPEKQTVLFKKKLQLDLGGIGKGYIADQVMAQLKAKGITSAAVAIGSDTVLSNPPPGQAGWTIGLENPHQEIIGTVTLSNTALSTSGDSYQSLSPSQESHLIQSQTGQGTTNQLNVIVLAPSATQADAWATTYRLLGSEKSIPLNKTTPEIKALFIDPNNSLSKTNHFPKIQRKE